MATDDAHKRSHADYMPEYLLSKNFLLARALERSLELLGW